MPQCNFQNSHLPRAHQTRNSMLHAKKFTSSQFHSSVCVMGLTFVPITVVERSSNECFDVFFHHFQAARHFASSVLNDTLGRRVSGGSVRHYFQSFHSAFRGNVAPIFVLFSLATNAKALEEGRIPPPRTRSEFSKQDRAAVLRGRSIERENFCGSDLPPPPSYSLISFLSLPLSLSPKTLHLRCARVCTSHTPLSPSLPFISPAPDL